jgi:pilus assembly protein CpaB
MRAVFALVLVLGLGLAGFAVYMAQGFIEKNNRTVAALKAERALMPATVHVVVVNKPKAYGERLLKDDLKTVIWQADSVPEGAFVAERATGPSLQEAMKQTEANIAAALGTVAPEGKPERYVLRTIDAFEPVLASKVTEPGEDAGITSRLTRGMRAFAIRVDVSSGVSGFLRPGDRVDVYWTGAGASAGILGQDVTKLIQTGIRLIAVDQMADSDSSAPVIARTITVEATPQQVARLAQAQTTGRLSLSLVGAEDDTVAQVVEVDQRSLLGIEEIAPEIIAQERVCTTKIRRGADVIEQEIPCTN